MQVSPPTDVEDLAPLAESWNALAAGVPFRSWDWCSIWWRHYGADGKWFTPTILDEAGSLAGIAPWCVSRTAGRGRVVRFLGSGEVASDYQSILCRPGREIEVSAALADWLTGEALGEWDLLELIGVDAEDPAVACLAIQLAERGATVHQRDGLNCWRLEFPENWDVYQAGLSKSHRKQMRRLETRYLDTGRAVLRATDSDADFDPAMETLIDLHQRRWQAQGEPGCFASPRFEAFHRQIGRRLLQQGLLRLYRLELDGRPIAADYGFTGGGLLYAYQGGVEPEALEDEPGRLMNVASLRRAMQEGLRGVDFLRGDEPYKAHFRAVPRRSIELRIAAPRSSARLRQSAWTAGENVKRWAKRRLRWAEGPRPRP